MASLPDQLHQLALSQAESYTVITEHRRPSDMRPSVWEIEVPGQQRWFVKQHVGDKMHGREVDAYRNWTYLLGRNRPARLVAADAVTRSVIITALPGRSLDRLRLPAAEEREAYRQAGQLLARLHAATSAACAFETKPVTDPDAWTTAVTR